jgi:hypothetical protein
MQYEWHHQCKKILLGGPPAQKQAIMAWQRYSSKLEKRETNRQEERQSYKRLV